VRRIAACPRIAGAEVCLYLCQFPHQITLAPPVDADYALFPIDSYYERETERENASRSMRLNGGLADLNSVVAENSSVSPGMKDQEKINVKPR